MELPSSDFLLAIGRKDDCEIRLADAGVSRHHARLSRQAGALFLEDLGSSAGTFVNGRRVSARTPVQAGDDLRIGPCQMKLSEPDAGEVPPSPPSSGEKAPALSAQIVPKSVAEAELIEEFQKTMVLYEPAVMELTHSIHEDILERINHEAKGVQVDCAVIHEKAERVLDQVLRERRHEIPPNIPLAVFRQALLDEIIDLGPISPLVRSDRITEIMVNGPDKVFVEVRGRDEKSYLIDSGVRFFSERHLISIIQRIVEGVGRRVDDASPMVDARLPDGSRVNAIIPPLALKGAALTIRKFSKDPVTMEKMVNKWKSLSWEMAKFLEAAVKARQNILVSGGTGSGKTTLLNVLSHFIPRGERVITVEDSAELKLDHPNLVSLEARPANVEGSGRVTIRDLVINTLRMRPDRIIVGECRGAEALDMLQAMNTGHDGSLTTAHANDPRDALSRLENMVMMAGFDLPSKAIREQISSALNLIIQESRFPDGSRKIVQISEVTGREGDTILMQDIFTFEQTGIEHGADGKPHIEGYYTATGNIPQFIEEQRKTGSLTLDTGVFVPKN